MLAMPSPRPAVLVPETSFLQIHNASLQVNCADRAAFLVAVRDALGDQPGAIGRAIAVAFRTYWRAPQLPVPRPRAYYKNSDRD
jgi:hypothetical protein